MNNIDLNLEIEKYLAEAAKDGKILRKLNIDVIKKEIPMEQGESPRDYNARLQQIEANPTEEEHYGHFPPELVKWVEELPDSTFPSSGRKMFTKWLANVIYYEETEGSFRASLNDQFKDLSVYEGGIQYIVDFLNGSNNIDNKIWNLNYHQMYEAAEAWHQQLATQGKDFRDNMGKLGYMTNKVVYKFKNGYSIVEVDAEKERDYTEAEAYRCYWAKDYEMASKIESYWAKKNKNVHVSIRKTVTDLDIEGCAMGHCVGGYCDAVRYGDKTIFSLRDRKNEPHATIEVALNVVRQIKGFANEVLNEKYRPMVKEWLRTTNYDYKNSSDYINLIPPEEILQMIDTGEATGRLLYQLASESDDQEALSKLLAIVDDVDTIRKIEGANGGALLVALSSNRRLGPELVMKVLEKNLTMKVLGRRLEDQFYNPFPELGETRLPGHELAPLVWEKFGDILKTGRDEEYLYYMEAIAHFSQDERLGRELVNTILSSEFVDEQILGDSRDGLSGSLRIKDHIELSFGKILQLYLINNKNHDRETLNKMLKFIKTDEGRALAGGPRRIDSYFAKSLSITDDMVEELLSRPGDLGTTERMNLLTNPNVDEKYKYEMLNRLRKRTSPDAPNLYLNGLAKKLVAEAEVFSHEFLQWLAKEGWLWPYFVDMARGELQKKSSKAVEKDSPEVQQLAASRQALFLHNSKTPDDIFEHANKFKLFYDTLNLQDDIENYFFKLMDE